MKILIVYSSQTGNTQTWIAEAPKAVGHPNATDIQRLADTVKVLLPEF
jgi:menaquinone-dependent protoporphyrinogen IX oxidase